MQKTYILNPDADTLDLRDALSEKIKKARAIIVAIMADGDDTQFTLAHGLIIDALWAVEGYLDDIDVLSDALDLKRSSSAA